MTPPKLDMMTALKLTKEGKLKEAAALLRGVLPGTAAGSAANAPGRRPAFPASGNTSLFSASAAATAGIDLRKIPEVLKAVAGKVGQLGAAAAAIAPLPQGGGAPQPPPPGAQFLARQFASTEGRRDYKLYIPSSYHGQPMPLVVMLHGCTQSPDDFAAGTRMNELAEANGFLVAYPGQSRAANPQKCWNWFKPEDQQRGQGEPAILAGITREVIGEFAVQPGHVYIAGLSAGGAAAAVMGTAYPDLYAAVGIHSGLACGAATDMGSAMMAMRRGAPNLAATSAVIPTIVFHGDSDNTVNAVNADQIIKRLSTDLDIQTEQGKSTSGVGYTRRIYTKRQHALLEQWTIHGGGHAWSGGSSAGSFTEPRGPDASSEMLRFFLGHETGAAH